MGQRLFLGWRPVRAENRSPQNGFLSRSFYYEFRFQDVTPGGVSFQFYFFGDLSWAFENFKALLQ